MGVPATLLFQHCMAIENFLKMVLEVYIQGNNFSIFRYQLLTLLHSERLKLYTTLVFVSEIGILVYLSAIGFKEEFAALANFQKSYVI